MVDLVVSGTLMYANEGATLTILDVQNPLRPVRLSSLPFRNDAPIFAIAGDMAYIVDEAHDGRNNLVELRIIDIHAPTHPISRGSLTLSSQVGGLQVAGPRLYVQTSQSIIVVDVADPDRPRVVGTYTPSPGGGDPSQLVIAELEMAGSLGYLVEQIDVSGYSRLSIVDFSTPTQPMLRGSYPSSGAIWRDMQLVGNRVYLANLESLSILDVSNAAKPTLLGSIPVKRGLHVQVFGQRAYVFGDSLSDDMGGFGGASLTAIAVDDPAHPVSVGTAELPGIPLSLAAASNRLYLTLAGSGSPGRLQIWDLAQPGGLTLRSSTPLPGWPIDLRLLGNIAYLALLDAGGQILDVQNPAQPSVVGTFGIGATYALKVAGERAYAATQTGLHILDLSASGDPVLLGSVLLPIEDAYNRAYTVQVSGTLAYMGAGDGLYIVDVSDPLHPTLRKQLARTGWGSVVALQVVGNIAYIVPEEAGLQIVDVGDPANPAILGSVGSPATYTSVQVAGTWLYVTIVSGGGVSDVLLVDVSNPAQPQIRKTVQKDISLFRLVQNRAYVLAPIINSSEDAFTVLDARQPDRLLQLGITSLSTGVVSSLEVAGGVAYIGSAAGGASYIDELLVLDASNPAQPTLRTRFTTPDMITDVQAIGDQVYLANGENGFRVQQIDLASYPKLFLPLLRR
jgi:hypothetical protein